MNKNNIEIIRWSGDKVPDEATLRKILADEDLHPR
jgi:hypothetical protein